MISSNKKRLVINLLLLAMFFVHLVGEKTFAADEHLDTATTLNGKIEYNKVHADNLNSIELNLGDDDKLQLREDSPDVKLDSVIKLTQEEAELKDALEFQKGKDVEDIKNLWDATVARNEIIKFALHKISTPPEKRAVKTSLMARSVATMIQGSAILPSLFGMGAMAEYTSALGGQVITNAFAKKFVPNPGMPAITEPELIQLTGFVEKLQNEIIDNYYDYKNALESLMLERKNTLLQAQNYQKALDSNDETAIIISSSLYDKSKLSELKLKQQVKLHRIQLERMAGLEAVSELNLKLDKKLTDAKYDFEISKLINKNKEEKALKTINKDKETITQPQINNNKNELPIIEDYNSSDTDIPKAISDMKLQDKKEVINEAR